MLGGARDINHRASVSPLFLGNFPIKRRIPGKHSICGYSGVYLALIASSSAKYRRYLLASAS